jgi:DNA invertase Pin-like site-specific DNA recombinase
VGKTALKEGGAGLRSLGEPWADTTSPAGKMVLTVFAGMAEFERALIHQRTSSGRVAARTRGVRFGRPPRLTPEQIALGRRLVDEGTSVREVAKMILKCHPATLYRELSKSSPASKQANALAGERKAVIMDCSNCLFTGSLVTIGSTLVLGRHKIRKSPLK